ncbi:UNVERIFIED_CONTAM: hypothetical protein HDU68_012197 [Siphonaria sp. JEL0065]|nr:hypothetical protein HDU68_012197 [Siphonaria sp. JEL0065]
MQIKSLLLSFMTATSLVSASDRVTIGGRCREPKDCEPNFTCFSFFVNGKTDAKCREYRGEFSQCNDGLESHVRKNWASFEEAPSTAVCDFGFQCLPPLTPGRVLNEGMVGVCRLPKKSDLGYGSRR